MTADKPMPDWSKPVDVLAFMFRAEIMCGCVPVYALVPWLCATLASYEDRVLPWADMVERVYHDDVGLAYGVTLLLERAGLLDHGTSARGAFLTEDGRALLGALRKHGAEGIAQADGEAYDGCSYGVM